MLFEPWLYLRFPVILYLVIFYSYVAAYQRVSYISIIFLLIPNVPSGYYIYILIYKMLSGIYIYKLVYNSNNYIVYGTCNELVTGANLNQQT